MSITKAGVLCDVCGMYCVTEMLLGEGIEQFSIKGIANMLHCDEKCKQVLIDCGSDWTKLPNGPLRKVFEDQEAKNASKESV